MNQIKSVAVVVAGSTNTADGIRDYSQNLIEQLREVAGVDVQLFQRDQSAFSTKLTPADGQRLAACAAAEVVIVQYNPFWYGRRGFAPGLPYGILRLRRRGARPRIVLMVHETYVDAKNWRWALMRMWQRAQLWTLQQLSDVQLCSIEAWTERLRRSVPRVPAQHLPVPSNLPDRRVAREVSRARLGIGEQTLVLATFGLRHPGRLTERMLAAARTVAESGRDAVVLNLGSAVLAEARSVEGVSVISPGYLEADQAAEALSAADIFMAAFADGVSTRRTTVMAALQHEIATVGTDGHLTDSVMRNATGALRLVPVEHPKCFVNAVAEIATNDAKRQRLARGGRELYAERFDWPVLVDSLLEILEEPAR